MVMIKTVWNFTWTDIYDRELTRHVWHFIWNWRWWERQDKACLTLHVKLTLMRETRQGMSDTSRETDVDERDKTRHVWHFTSTDVDEKDKTRHGGAICVCVCVCVHALAYFFNCSFIMLCVMFLIVCLFRFRFVYRIGAYSSPCTALWGRACIKMHFKSVIYRCHYY